MADSTVNFELVNIALERVTGSIFEQFVNAFYPSIAGEAFIPLGGHKDGGADAFQADVVWEGDTTGIFYQASIEADYRGKISRTINRLREFGRIPKRLVYVTSQLIKHIDIEEVNLSNKHNVDVRIRDKSYIISHINDYVGTREAFETYLAPTLSFLSRIASTNNIVRTKHASSPAIYVFLRQELDRREGKEGLINALADGLILWALEETDPDKGILMYESEISKKIEATVPAAAKILRGVITKRLIALSTGRGDSTRSVRWYRKRNQFCLAFEYRKVVAHDNSIDESIRVSVRDIFVNRLQGIAGTKLSSSDVQTAADISLAAIQKIYENQGLEFAAFVSQEKQHKDIPTIVDFVDQSCDEHALKPKQRFDIKEAVLANLQGAFYASEEAERLFFSRLSATYTLLFCLNTEPRIVEYFQNMAADFYLYVGADLLVRALSERYLRPADQMTRNAFKVIQEAGGKLVLSAPVLEEVYTHLRATDYEFENYYRPNESSLTLDFARNSDRILIRAYFYAKLRTPEGIKPPNNWEQYIGQFCDPSKIRIQEGQEQVRRYLMAQYNMAFEDVEELMSVTSRERVEELAGRIEHTKKMQKLAFNDALMVLAVYGRRRKREEVSKISQYGYRTWWLTGESTILQYTKDLEEKEQARYMMRPEFLLNFFALAPSAHAVRQSYRSIFPSILGIRLGRRMNPKVLHAMLNNLTKAKEVEPGRREAMISEYSDRLKTVTYGKPVRDEETLAQ
jgi:hypothetical protein